MTLAYMILIDNVCLLREKHQRKNATVGSVFQCVSVSLLKKMLILQTIYDMTKYLAEILTFSWDHGKVT